MDLNYITALLILAVRKQSIEDFSIAYSLMVNHEENEANLEYKNKEVINIISRVYETEVKGTNNIDAYVLFVKEIAKLFIGFSVSYYEYKLLADIIEYPLSDKLDLIKLMSIDVSDINEKREILFLKLNVANHELNYIEIENLVTMIQALNV